MCEIIALPVFTLGFRKSCLDMRLTCASFHAASVGLWPLVLKFLTIEEKFRLICYCVGQRIAFAPQTWFRCNAFCWIVDEDCQVHDQKRREGTFAGVSNFVGNVGRASASGFLYLGLSEAGLKTKNCALDCEGAPDGCMEAC